MASAGNRILMMVENCSYPADKRVRCEAKTLVAAGYQVTVISPANPGQSAREVVDGVRVYRYPEPRAGDGLIGFLWEYGYSLVASFYLSLVILFREGFDVLHCHNPPDLFVLIALPYKLLGKQFVFDHHDLSPEMYVARLPGEGSKIVVAALVFFEKLTCWVADHVIATNESYKRVEMERGRVPEDRISIVRNGPDFERVQLQPEDAQLRQKAGTILGYVGVMGFQDGIDYFIRALNHLRNDLGQDDFYCVMIGKGDARESLMKLTDGLGLGDHVWFTGRVSDEELMNYLSTADICIDSDPKNPFNDRSTMIKMMEYMALAKPIVAFDLTEHRATAADCALYATGNDELEFARQIAQLMEDPQLGKEMGERGRQRVLSQLAWHHQEPHLISAYRQLLARRGRQHQPTAPANPTPARSASKG